MFLDTNALSDLQQQNPGLLSILENEPILFLNLISLGEYRYGIDGSRYRDELLLWLRELQNHSQILIPDLDTLPHYSQIRHELRNAGTPIPANDIWIAALCRQHRLPILSNDAHFDRVHALKRLSW